MSEATLFAGCILVLVVFGAVVVYYKTALFGLTLLNVFFIASSTLPAFFFATLFDEVPHTFTPEHAYVVAYSIAGLLAMAAGVYFGWRPLKETGELFSHGRLGIAVPTHINEQVGWLTFCVGMVAEFGLRFVYDVPTLSTAVNCLAGLGRIGLIILLVNALTTGRWNRFIAALVVFAILSVFGSLASGHTFIRVNAILPLVIVFLASSPFRLRYVLPSVLALPLLIPPMIAWMDSRYILRAFGGSDTYGEFFAEFLFNLRVPDPATFITFLLLRVDMTDILAEQVRYQPDYEPYAHGETLYSAFYTLIPRFIWTDKPQVAGGSEFVARFTGIVRPVDDTTSVGVAYPFELYANGGPVLVVLGLAVLGFVCARLELNLLRAPKSLGGFWALALFTAVLCEGGQRSDVVLPALVAAALSAYALGKIFEEFVLARNILSIPDPHTPDRLRSS